MAASMMIEEESGIFSARQVHPHNGYYAGDFWSDGPAEPAAWTEPIARFDARAA